MKYTKNVITLSLIVSSILLLIILQVFWLQSAYEQAFFDLNRESNLLFRTTIMNMRNDLFLKRLEPVHEDSLRNIENGFYKDSIRVITNRHFRSKREEGGQSIQVYIASSPDSLKKFERRSIVNINRLDSTRPLSSFVIRLEPDTLQLDSIKIHYENALTRADIGVPFIVKHIEEQTQFRNADPLNPIDVFFNERGHPFDFERQPGRKQKLDIYLDSIFCLPVRINPLHMYSASLYNIRGSLLEQITPQIVFSIMLTMITTGAFIFMYRNIVSQQKLMSAKNDFISNVTHELKTPVATVSVALEALKNFNAIDNPKLTQEYLDIAQRELNRLSLMTDKILKTSVFESNGLDFMPEPVQLDKIVKDVIDSLKIVFEKREAQIHFSMEGDNFMTTGDPVHLTNAVFNLIDNALKYSEGNPVIQILLQCTDYDVVLVVKDEGIGIPHEFHKKVFEKFFRVPTGDVHNIKGYGLGLNYVSTVVMRHRGSVLVKSEPGKGTEVIIKLPQTKFTL